MRVFISWSGDLSQEVAAVLKEWLPSVVQALKPYVSSEDIEKGARWSADIAVELESCNFGIICVTPENLQAPWIHFEAGALSKTVDRSRVVPFLFNVKRSTVTGPLTQFQSTLYEEKDVLNLLKSLNSHSAEPLGEASLEAAFEVWWPRLQESLDRLLAQARSKAGRSAPNSDLAHESDRGEMIEEMLELVRSQQRLLSSPQDLLPVEYLEFALQTARRRIDELPPMVAERVHREAFNIRELAIAERHLEDSVDRLAMIEESAQRILSFLCRGDVRSRRLSFDIAGKPKSESAKARRNSVGHPVEE